MNQQQNAPRQTNTKTTPQKHEDDGKLENLANLIDPAGRDVSNKDLNDPGRMTPGARPTENRS